MYSYFYSLNGHFRSIAALQEAGSINSVEAAKLKEMILSGSSEASRAMQLVEQSGMTDTSALQGLK